MKREDSTRDARRADDERTARQPVLDKLAKRVEERGDLTAVLDDFEELADVAVDDIRRALEARLGKQHRTDIDEAVDEFDDVDVQTRIDYADRHRNVEWRTNWFHLTRSWADQDLDALRDRELRYKRKLIDEQRDIADHLAGYAPVGTGVGTPWFSIGPRNINGRVKSIAVSPTDEDTVFAGAASGGVWRSTDGAESWDPLWNDQESLAVGAIAVAPSDANRVYAGTGEWTPGYGPSYPGAGLFVSTDGGDSWTQETALGSGRVAAVAVSPTDPDSLYVAGNAGLEQSTDGGSNWTTVRSGQASDVVVDPNDSDTVYVAIRWDAVYKSTDAGSNWTRLTDGPTGSDASWLRLDIGATGTPGSDHVVAKRAGTIYETTDGGSSWSTLSGSHGGSSFDTWCNLVATAPDDEDILLAGGVGIERTDDGGSSWNGLSGLHADHHRAVFAPTDTDRVYACNDGGVYRSDDKGDTWEKASHGLVVTQFYDVGAWDDISTVLGGGTQDQGTNMTPGGLTWNKILGADGGYFVVHPDDPRTIYAETQNTNIRKSTDGGNSWTSKTGGLTGNTPWTGVITMDPNDPDTLFTGTNRVFRTTDGIATNWNTSSQVLAGQVSTIAVAEADSDRVYAGAGDRVYRSDDNGATDPWDDKTTGTLPNENVTDIAVDRSDEDHVFVGFARANATGSAETVFESTDGGNNWSDASGNLPGTSVNALALDPNDDQVLFIGTDTGVYRTTDGGSSWQAFDNGLPNVIVSDLHVDPKDDALYASTMGRGMYKVSIAGTTEPTVDLYLRDSALDTGERLPSPSGEPHPNDTSDTVHWWESPDIKVDASPFYTQDAVFDGVEFDTELQHDDPRRSETNRVYLQVHNRGWQDTTDVDVRVFYADASAGLPPLPTDFWSAFPDSDPADTSTWAPIGPARTISTIEPNRPKTVSWDWTVPSDAAGHTCLLAVVSGSDDPVTTTERNVDMLVNSEKRVALKNVQVVDSPGPRATQQLLPLRFANARQTADTIDIVVDPISFDGGTIGLLLEDADFVNEAEAFVGVERYAVREGENIGTWYDAREGTDQRHEAILSRVDRSTIYEFDPTKRAELRGIEIDEGQTIQGLLTVQGSSKVDYDESMTFDVMQRQDDRIVGGSTYEVRLTRARDLHPVSNIRIVLDSVEILSDREPWFRGDGEFSFTAAVSFNGQACRTQTCRVPPSGHFKAGSGDVIDLDTCIYEGYVAEDDDLSLSVHGVEADWPDPDDELTLFERQFPSPPEAWPGQYGPGDEQPGSDPEDHDDWRLSYRIESLPL